MYRWSIIFVHVVASATLGCSSKCTTLACEATATLLFPHTLSTQGSYVVHIDGDGKSTECTLTVSDASQSPLKDSSARCNNPTVEWSVTSAPSQDTSNTENIYIEGIRWLGQPKELSVGISRDSIMLISRSVEPAYLSDEPNGPGCGICPTSRTNIETGSP